MLRVSFDVIGRPLFAGAFLAVIISLSPGCSGRLGAPTDVDADTGRVTQTDGDAVAFADGDDPPAVDADENQTHDADSVARSAVQVLVDSLDVERFTENIRELSSFGDRTEGSASYDNAESWLEEQLEAAGYTVERHDFYRSGQTMSNLYVTKVGESAPNEMFIVSAHLDGRGNGGAADDDGSGVALVLEAARAMSRGDLRLDSSVRFIFWNAEESGLNGAEAYVDDRADLQGVEDPPGSGRFPEPTWLGMIQHDMILFDHGLPPQPTQSPTADVDVEYQARSGFADDSCDLAQALVTGATTYSTEYPAEMSDEMSNTDSVAFEDCTASVSIRENRRLDEIGAGSNPHWHQPTDIFSTYSEADFLLGFNALQMTLATVAELSGARLE